MKHKVSFSIPPRLLGKSDLIFVIKKNKNKFGTLRISQGGVVWVPKGKKYADDRIPTVEEIRKVVEYPDRRIKAIVCTMASSGIRIGAWDYLQWGHIRP